MAVAEIGGNNYIATARVSIVQLEGVLMLSGKLSTSLIHIVFYLSLKLMYLYICKYW
jgi:hypothetical protein